MNTHDLYSHNQSAYNALPSPYQNDDCLFFWEEHGTLYCRPKDGEEFALGSWVCLFDSLDECWIQDDSDSY